MLPLSFSKVAICLVVIWQFLFTLHEVFFDSRGVHVKEEQNDDPHNSSISIVNQAGNGSDNVGPTIYESSVESALREDVPLRKKALLMRTVSPIKSIVLHKMYQIAADLHSKPHLSAAYDFWIQVDVTKTPLKNATERIYNFFGKHSGVGGGNNSSNNNSITVPPPQIFAVSETTLLEHYPKLISYIRNEPDKNFHDEPGRCCGQGIMWQMFIPTFALFLTQHTQSPYDYHHAWSLEDDIGCIGQFTMMDLIAWWDSQLDDEDDLAALELPFRGRWGKHIHTMPMEAIVQKFQKQNVRWTMYSDSIQRHSIRMAENIVDEVSQNVMQFGERLVFPIAWKHNRTMVDLRDLRYSKDHPTWPHIEGLDDMTDDSSGPRAKKSHPASIDQLLSIDTPKESENGLLTLLFHEKFPNEDDWLNAFSGNTNMKDRIKQRKNQKPQTIQKAL